MKKQSKRRVRPASEPALVRLATNPKIGIAERMAIQAMRGGWADYQNSYRVLADCHGVLTLGLKRKKDDSLKGVLQLAMIALLNIYDRYGKSKKIGATGAFPPAEKTAYNEPRLYPIPQELLKEENILAVRVADFGGNGGIWRGPVAIGPADELQALSATTE